LHGEAVGKLADSPDRDENVRFAALRMFLRDLLSAWSADRPARLAAALAYYAMFSIAPMAWVAVTVAGIFINERTVIDRVAVRIGQSLGPELVQLLEGMVSSRPGRIMSSGQVSADCPRINQKGNSSRTTSFRRRRILGQHRRRTSVEQTLESSSVG
jgi:hypothetical protein